jgi:hypothetical protein
MSFNPAGGLEFLRSLVAQGGGGSDAQTGDESDEREGDTGSDECEGDSSGSDESEATGESSDGESGTDELCSTCAKGLPGKEWWKEN